MRASYVDERLSTSGFNSQKQHRASRPTLGGLRGIRSLLLPILALVAIAAIPLLLFGRADVGNNGMPLDASRRTRRESKALEPNIRQEIVLDAPSTMSSDLSSSPPPPSPISAAVQPKGGHPPYSTDGDCKRPYDRSGHGDAFVRCGRSCCRSHAGESCYYLADSGLCDRFLGAAGGDADPFAAMVARTAASTDASASNTATDGDDGDDDDDDDDNEDATPPATTTTTTTTTTSVSSISSSSSSSSSLSSVYASASSVTSMSAAVATATSSESLQKLVPLTPLPSPTEGGARRPRMLKYPLFNLTWTRGAPPPRSDGWAPTEGQRKRLPDRDLKERYYQSCAIVGSSGTLRRSGYGRFIDAHELVMRFNGAPAGGGYEEDVGARTTLAVLADVATTDCVANKARQPTLDRYAATTRMDGNLLLEPSPGWRQVSHCLFYPEAEPPPSILFLPKRDGVRRLLEYALDHANMPVYIRSDALGDEVDAQIRAFQDDTSHPTSGFNGAVLALHMCETVDFYGFGSPRDKFYSPPRAEKAGSQHLYRTEMRWLLGLERRFPGRVHLWP